MAEHASRRPIWIAFWILLFVTIAEIALALSWPKAWPPMALNIIFLGMTFIKAFFIVSEFMHLKYEVNNMILTVLLLFTLFIWFIIAFLYEGNSWLLMRGW